MAIQYVGGFSGSRAGATSNFSQSLSGTLTGGIDTSPKPHDLVIVTVVVGSAGRNANEAIVTPADYTALAQLNPNTQSFDTSLCVSYKRMSVAGADTSVTIPSSGNNQDAQAWTVQVFRGVDFDSPMDVTPVSATGTGTTRADPPSITPTTPGAVVVVCSGGAAGTASALTYAALSNVLSQAQVDTNDAVVGSGWTTWSSGALDPAASSTGDATSTSSWAAYTLALRPLPTIDTPQDDFEDGSIAALWNAVPATGQTVTETGGAIEIDLASVIDYSTFYIHDNGYYNLTGSRLFFRFVQPPQGLDNVDAGYECFLRLSDDTGSFLIDAMHWYTDASATGSVESRYDNDGTGTVTIGSAASYSPSTHAWWSIRESGGTVFIETAPDTASNPPVSGDWVSFASITLATLAKPITSITFGFQAGAFTDPGTHPTGPMKIDGVNTAATASGPNAIESIANPATYSMTAPDAKSNRAITSSASPSTYSVTTSSPVEKLARITLPSPATYSLTGVTSKDAIAKFSSALAAVYSYTGAASQDYFGKGSIASPATFSLTGFAATSTYTAAPGATISAALAATFTMTGFAATSVYQAGSVGIESIASPATFSFTGFAITVHRAYVSNATPATFLMNAKMSGEENTGDEIIPVSVPPVGKEPLSDIEFLEWLRDPDAIRVVLVETQGIDSNGNTTLVYFGSRGFTTKLEDGPDGRYYSPAMKGGLDFQQTLGLDLSGEESYGDIALENIDGGLDWMFGHVWLYQPLKAFVGDARWPRRDFRQIFDGAIEDIDSSARDTVNIRLRDKLYRLEMPLHEQKIGGASADADHLLPVAFGECHNVTPVLVDPNDLSYVFHAGVGESVFEVRDNGIPIQRLTRDGAPATFTLPKQPFGRITASIQGDVIQSGHGTAMVGPSEGYFDTVPMIVINLVQNWGTEIGKRFTDDDIDWIVMSQFLQDNVEPVGLYVTDRMTVKQACDTVAAAVGARTTMSALGKLQLVKLQVPPIGTPINVGMSDMVAGSLKIANRLPLVPSVKLGYCKNWTVQEDTAGGLPEEHKALFSREWLSTTAVNSQTRDLYNLWGEPEQENSLLVDREDAAAECGRRLWLRTYQRHVYEFTGYADLILTAVGQPMRITHPRFGLEGGKTGQVVAVSVDWLSAQVTIQVLI